MDNPVDNNLYIPGPYTKITYSSQPEDDKQELSPADRRLLDDFVSGKNRDVTPELAARFLYHYRQNILEYNGWQGETRSNQHAVFLNTLAGVYSLPAAFERFQAGLLSRQDPKDYLAHFTRQEAKFYLHCKEDLFLQKYDDLQKERQDTTPGPLRVSVFRAISDLRSLALSRGSSLVVHDNLILEKPMPDLTYAEYQTIERIEHYTKLADGRGVSPHREYYLQSFADFARRYIATTDVLHKESLALALGYFEKSAVKFNVRASELDQIMGQICQANNYDLKSKGRLNNMAELGKVVFTEVGPEGLPVEIKELLVKTGYWDFVQNNLSAIFLTPGNKAESSLHIGGVAKPLLRWAKIVYEGPDGKPRPLWQIAEVLIHEAGHNNPAWRSLPPIMQNPVIKERHAYAAALAFMDAYADYAKSHGLPYDSKAFNEEHRHIERTIKTANEIIGYPLNDLSVENKNPPDARLCRQRGVASVEELDLSYYPDNPAPSFLADKSDFDKLVARTQALDPATAGLLWEVAEGKAELTVLFAPGLPKITLSRPTGKRELPAAQVKRLANFFARIKGLNSSFISVGLLQTSKGSPDTYRISSASLRKGLYNAIK